MCTGRLRDRQASTWLALILLGIGLSGCSEAPMTGTPPLRPGHAESQAHVPDALKALPPSAAAQDLTAYTAQVSATQRIELPGAKGTLTVWIGLPKNLPATATGFVSSAQPLGMGGQSAKVTPYAPDFEVSPTTTQCIHVAPSGSEVIFALTALHAGDFTVGANVQLYDSADCSGAPTPKTPNTIQVRVQVCSLCYVKSGLATLGATTWQAFTHFWAWLIGALFATLIVIINRWRQRRFHTPDDNSK